MADPTDSNPGAQWRKRSDETPEDRLRRSIEHSNRFQASQDAGTRAVWPILLVTGGDAFNDRHRVFLAMHAARERCSVLSAIVVGRERWPGAEFRAGAWARNLGYAVHRLETVSSLGAEDAYSVWIRTCASMPGLRGVKAWRPSGEPQ